MPQTSTQTSTDTSSQPSDTDRPVTDAVVEPTAFLDKDLHEGDHGADSVRAVLINRSRLGFGRRNAIPAPELGGECFCRRLNRGHPQFTLKRI
jgi:hypothetical protein